MTKVTITLELPVDSVAVLDHRAEEQHLSRSELITSIFSPPIELTDEQWKEVEAGLAEADAGIFATDEEVAAVLDRFRNPK